MSASANQSSSSSTENELNVLVAALGLTGSIGKGEFVRDLDALADRAEERVGAIARMNSQSVDTVVVRENYALAEALEARFDGDGPDVQYHLLDWRMMLDDVGEEYDDGQKEIPAVMQDDDSMIVELMQEVDAEYDVEAMADALEMVDDEFDAETDEFVLEEDFDLNIREHRNEIPYSELDQSRVNRAKAKARSKTDEQLYSDWDGYSVPTVDAAVFLHDGTDRGMEALANARGNNDWVKFPSECELSLEASCNRDEDTIVDWEQFMLRSGDLEADDLHESQEADLRERFDEETLADLGVDVEASPETQATPGDASGPQPAMAD